MDELIKKLQIKDESRFLVQGLPEALADLAGKLPGKVLTQAGGLNT